MTPSSRVAALALAVLLVSSAQAAPPKDPKKEETKPATTGPVAVAVSSENPVSVLSEQLGKSLPAQEDAASRLSRFMLSKSSTAAYVADKVKSDADALKRLNALPIVWVKKKIETSAAHKVAMLYFVLGEDLSLGAWAKPFPILKRVEDKGTERAKILDTNMELFTADRAKAVKDNPSLAARYTGPYTGAPKAGVTAEAALDGWVTGFFDFAAERAEAILAEPRVKKEIADSIKAHAEAPTEVPGVGDKKSRLEAAEDARRRAAESFSAFDYAGCYERGGLTAYIPLDEKGKYRHISIKMYTVWDQDEGAWVNKIGIFDISVPGTPPDRIDSKIFGQIFPLNQSGESVFRLDDRKAGTAQYKLTMGSDGSISFSNPSNAENAIKTSIRELYDLRKEQVQREGVILKVNGEHFKVIGQGGFRGGWLYFPADESGKLTGEAPGTKPALAVETSQGGLDGRTERMPGPRHLGFVGKNAEGKPQFMYLLWNQDANGGTGAFEPKTCEELKARCALPPPKPKSKPKKDKEEGGGEGGKDKPGKDKPEGGGGGEEGAGEGGEAGGGEGGGEGGDGHDIETGKPSFTKKCEIKASQFPGDSMRERTMQGWTLFVSQQKDHGNYAQFCMNGAKQHMFNVSGIVARADTKDGNVVIETFTPESFIDPSLLGESWKVVDNQIVAGSHKFKVTAHYVYYVPLSALAPEAFETVAEKGTAPVDKVASVKLDVDVMNVNAKKRMNVYLRSAGNADRAVSAVKTQLERHAKDSPLNAREEHKKKLLDYIKAEAGKASGKKIELDAYATIVLYLSSELSNTGAESGGTDNYKEVVPTLKLAKGLDHPKLVYCGVSSSLETLTEHVSKGHVPK